jgi:hypothetical protein
MRLVKRVIREDMSKNLKFKNLIIKYINELVKGGLYLEEGGYENDDYILFKKNDNDEIVFRYSTHDGKLLYSDKINNIPNIMFASNVWNVLPEKYEVLKKIVGEWVEENLIPEFGGEIEELTGKKSNDHARKLIMHGPDEVDLVYSGLEETMINATHEIMNAWRENPAIPDMRTAAYVVAINKVATIYAELGIFP